MKVKILLIPSFFNFLGNKNFHGRGINKAFYISVVCFVYNCLKIHNSTYKGF